MRYIVGLVLILLLMECKDRFSNKRTSAIYSLNTQCLSDSAWFYFEKNHSIKDIQRKDFLEILPSFKSATFLNEVYYFADDPEELIAICPNHYCVRYVYNPKIKKQILDGLSPQLKKKDKERIGSRVQAILRQYQCEQEKNHRYDQEWDEDPE